jgi:hypothetical protein
MLVGMYETAGGAHVPQAGAATTGAGRSQQPKRPAALHAGVMNTAAATAPAIVRTRTVARNMASPPHAKKIGHLGYQTATGLRCQAFAITVFCRWLVFPVVQIIRLGQTLRLLPIVPADAAAPRAAP